MNVQKTNYSNTNLTPFTAKLNLRAAKDMITTYETDTLSRMASTIGTDADSIDVEIGLLKRWYELWNERCNRYGCAYPMSIATTINGTRSERSLLPRSININHASYTDKPKVDRPFEWLRSLFGVIQDAMESEAEKTKQARNIVDDLRTKFGSPMESENEIAAVAKAGTRISKLNRNPESYITAMDEFIKSKRVSGTGTEDLAEGYLIPGSMQEANPLEFFRTVGG